jgi:hypothetical protein
MRITADSDPPAKAVGPVATDGNEDFCDWDTGSSLQINVD